MVKLTSPMVFYTLMISKIIFQSKFLCWNSDASIQLHTGHFHVGVGPLHVSAHLSESPFLPPPIYVISVHGLTIHLVFQAKNLAAIINSFLIFQSTIQFYQFCFQNISWIFPLLLSPLPIEHVYVLTTIITHLNDHSISLSGLPSSSLCIYSVLSPEWTSKMKNLTIRFQIDHHPFQWLSIDLKVNLEHLTLAYKTLYDLTPGHSSDWSFRWVVVLPHLL